MDKKRISKIVHEDLCYEITGAAIEVHRALGPGLLESAYEECLAHELQLRGLPCRRQVPLHIEYKGLKIENAYRLDLLINELVIVEVKAVEKLMPIHDAQLLTYLQLSDLKLGILFNFHSPVIKDAMKRIVR